MEGIIYCYTSPSGKKYIGQTIDEVTRRSVFNSINRNYCHGGKIDLARRKYGPENFKYEVLKRINVESKEELLEQLNALEKYYIFLFDTYKTGYNSTKGGRNVYSKVRAESQKGHVVSEETRKKISEKAKLRGFPKLTEEQRKKNIENTIKRCSKTILQYSLDGEFIKEWESATIAGKELGLCRISISDCYTKGKEQCGGFQWMQKQGTVALKIPPVKRKVVVRLDKFNNILKEFASPLEAADEFNPKDKKERRNISCCIAKCCREESSYKGVIYKYKWYGIE